MVHVSPQAHVSERRRENVSLLRYIAGIARIRIAEIELSLRGNMAEKSDTPAARSGHEIDPKLLELLVCPVTKGPLDYDRAAHELISRQDISTRWLHPVAAAASAPYARRSRSRRTPQVTTPSHFVKSLYVPPHHRSRSLASDDGRQRARISGSRRPHSRARSLCSARLAAGSGAGRARDRDVRKTPRPRSGRLCAR